MIRVVLADDQALMRAGLRALLQDGGIDVVAEVGDGDAAVRRAAELRPHVVLMDVRMPVMDGLEATRRIAGDPRLDAVKVLILTTFEIDEYVFDALRAGASGFVLKDSEPDELLRAIHAVAAGDAMLAPSVTRRLVREFASRAKEVRPAGRLAALTERERQVLVLAAQGLTNDEIAARLFVTLATAKTHISRAMTKLRARDRAQLVIMAYETGLIRPGWMT
ncbi:response regulator transcription factor [Dactylosporangium aurantiacum]|uniref:Response regulator transcription factor n=1 Tax=Dactylosporangium aurantiacum TaxID=35754 RepID=A0A9Q9MQC5_9ACTN|nr:response regulator transcription factor [Dactylosporangium aurantiacum]MDG6107774.1 response regulator transcription factor [Dactylosporangium aurantiacum]UWZ57447.1 response regulator transcription factor [Dactylosporangium aurantiacum]